MQLGKVSVVIPSFNEGQYLVDTVHCILENTQYPDFEVVVVDDASTDRSGGRVARRFGKSGRVSVVRTTGLGVAGARNFGAESASGDVLIFLDAHSYTPSGWMTGLLEPLEDIEVGMVGPAFASLKHSEEIEGLGIIWQDATLEIGWLPRDSDSPFEVPLLGGGCQVIRTEMFERLGGYDRGMTRWGSEDQELCLRVWLMGYSAVVQPRVTVHHLFRDSHPYQVEPAKVVYNRLRMALLHFSMERVARVIDALSGMSGFSEAITMLLESDTLAQRKKFEQLRQRDDSWFLARFGCVV